MLKRPALLVLSAVLALGMAVGSIPQCCYAFESDRTFAEWVELGCDRQAASTYW